MPIFRERTVGVDFERLRFKAKKRKKKRAKRRKESRENRRGLVSISMFDEYYRVI